MRADDLAGRGLGVLHIGRASGLLDVERTLRGPVYRRSLRGLAHRGDYGLVRGIGRTKALTSNGGAVPAEGRGREVLRYCPLETHVDNGSCCTLRKVPENVAL